MAAESNFNINREMSFTQLLNEYRDILFSILTFLLPQQLATVQLVNRMSRNRATDEKHWNNFLVRSGEIPKQHPYDYFIHHPEDRQFQYLPSDRRGVLIQAEHQLLQRYITDKYGVITHQFLEEFSLFHVHPAFRMSMYRGLKRNVWRLSVVGARNVDKTNLNMSPQFRNEVVATFIELGYDIDLLYVVIKLIQLPEFELKEWFIVAVLQAIRFYTLENVKSFLSELSRPENQFLFQNSDFMEFLGYAMVTHGFEYIDVFISNIGPKYFEQQQFVEQHLIENSCNLTLLIEGVMKHGFKRAGTFVGLLAEYHNLVHPADHLWVSVALKTGIRHGFEKAIAKVIAWMNSTADIQRLWDVDDKAKDENSLNTEEETAAEYAENYPEEVETPEYLEYVGQSVEVCERAETVELDIPTPEIPLYSQRINVSYSHAALYLRPPVQELNNKNAPNAEHMSLQKPCAYTI